MSFQLAKIKNNLLEAVRNFPQPTTNLSMFIAGTVPNAEVPAIIIFLLHHFAKAIVSQFANEAAVSPKLADPIGTLAINIFAMDDFRCNGLSLIDVLIAKLHVVCPPLFGIYGPETTNEGRKRLGWLQEPPPDGPFVQEQRHWDRTTGLGAGYAALALRYFERSKMQSPYPPFHFWNSIAMILNVPNGQVTDTHLVLVRAMLANNEARFLQFFGDAAKVVLRYAINEYPKKATKKSAAAMILSGLGDMWKKEKKLYL